MFLSLLDCFEDTGRKPFVSYRSVVALDIGVLLRFAGLDMLDGDVAPGSPEKERGANIFRPIIDPNVVRLSTPLDNLIQTSNHAYRRQ